MKKNTKPYRGTKVARNAETNDPGSCHESGPMIHPLVARAPMWRPTIPVRVTNQDQWSTTPRWAHAHVETHWSRFVPKPGPVLVPSDWSRFRNRDRALMNRDQRGGFSTSAPRKTMSRTGSGFLWLSKSVVGMTGGSGSWMVWSMWCLSSTSHKRILRQRST